MVDRDKVLKGLGCLADENSACHSDCPYFTDRQDDGFCFQKMAHDALELLQEQPEQKHGHWKGFTQSRFFGTDDYGEPIFRDVRFYICSECRRKSIIKYPYCPRCGAKMEEEVEQYG